MFVVTCREFEDKTHASVALGGWIWIRPDALLMQYKIITTRWQETHFLMQPLAAWTGRAASSHLHDCILLYLPERLV